jgi:hypothetical protein
MRGNIRSLTVITKCVPLTISPSERNCRNEPENMLIFTVIKIGYRETSLKRTSNCSRISPTHRSLADIVKIDKTNGLWKAAQEQRLHCR